MIPRREFVKLIGGAAAEPAAAHQKNAAVPVIGSLNSGSAADRGYLISAFRQGLQETGLIDGQNLAIEYRWADFHYDRLPELAADLVRRRVTVILAGSVPAALAAKAATSTVPIVFTMGGDPVQEGLVASLNRPGGNLTGVTLFFGELVAKRLELLRELVPGSRIIAALLNPNNPNAAARSTEIAAAARAVGQEVHIFEAKSEDEIEASFTALVQQRTQALLVGDDPFLESQRTRLVTLAARHGIPAIYDSRQYPAVGGLVSYGTDFSDIYRQAGNHAGRIVKGARPSDLPVLQPTKFELVINLKTAKALGLDVPPTLLARADEVIE
jgi:putative tryptophan/tyrosine transport system substrate-binding protein